jgi:hypothetical protein
LRDPQLVGHYLEQGLASRAARDQAHWRIVRRSGLVMRLAKCAREVYSEAVIRIQPSSLSATRKAA